METKFLPARVAGLAGIIFVILSAIPGFITGAPPDPGDPASKFLAYYQDHHSTIVAAGLAATVGTFFAIFFFAKWIATLRRVEGGSGALTLAALLGTLIVAGVVNVAGGVTSAAAFRLGNGEHPGAETIVALNDVSQVLFSVIGVPFAAFLLASGVIVTASRRLPRWLGTLAFAAGALEIIGSFSVLATSGAFAPGGIFGLFLGLLPFSVFVLAVSILMLTRPAHFDARVEAPTAR